MALFSSTGKRIALGALVAACLASATLTGRWLARSESEKTQGNATRVRQGALAVLKGNREGGRAAHVQLDCSNTAIPINPLIYGIAHGVVTSGESAHRIGGNAMTRLNWDLGNVWNTSADWFFQNVRGEDELNEWLRAAQARGLQMALTVPTIGWVAKDDHSVGFPVSRFGPQEKHDEHRPEAGNGKSPSGKPLKPGPPSLTSEPAPPERIERWVRQLRERDAASGKRSVHLYMLDNEPDLWHETHRDVHPEPVGYDELLERTIAYGSAVRRADPDAVIAGPASWGWPGYFFSGKDQAAGLRLQLDRRAHGGVPLIPWYLARLAEHERKSGMRVLDVLDVHYYPQAQDVYSDKGAEDPALAALRIRSTRSLWNPDYRDESWVDDYVQLLPRLRAWVDEHYPGRGIVLGEWSFGGEQHISGALATAEALGRFGQHGLTGAFYWNSPKEGSATYWAFRAYRNYDGKGARFRDFSVEVRSSGQISAFASRDEAGAHFVVILLNLDAELETKVELDAGSCGPLKRGRSFSYAGVGAGITPSAHQGDITLPPYSIGILELAKESRAGPSTP